MGREPNNEFDLHSYWKAAMNYFRWSYSRFPRETAEDFAGFCVLQHLKGVYHGCELWKMAAIYTRLQKLGREMPTCFQPFEVPAPIEQEAVEDFASITTASERLAMYREIDRSIVRPRQLLRERLESGDSVNPLDRQYVPRTKKIRMRDRFVAPVEEPWTEERLKSRALELLRELYGPEYG